MICPNCSKEITPIVFELKATFQSSVKDVTENKAWLRQIMAECYVLGVTDAYLSRLEIMGNWRSIFGKKEEKELVENRKPALSAWHLSFSQEELDANWAWLKQRKVLYEAVLDSGKPLPRVLALAESQTYLCERCAYNEVQCP